MKKRILPFVVMVLCCSNVFGQLTLVNPKGTRMSVDTSKWRLTGTHIISKNSGNIGIGIGNPAYKLDVSALANPLRLLGLQNGNMVTDSLVIVQNGVIKKMAPLSSFIINNNDSTTASNGLNLNGKDVRLGGLLTQATTITTNGNSFNITGLPNGTAATDSLVTVLNGQIKKLAPINTLIPNKNDSTTASNGLNLNGKDVRLGGTLTQATTITNNTNPLTIATGGSALNITGLPNGVSTTDSLVTVLNGQVKKLAPISTLIPNKNDSTTASNGLNLNGKDVRLGGNLTQATTITNNTNPLTIATGGSALNITGLPNGVSTTDSLVTVLNGQVKKLAPISTLIPNKNDSTTASNGLNLNGKDVRLGGNLTQATTITNNTNPLTIATGGSALNITGLPNGVSTTDSLVTVLNGQVKKLAPISTLIPNKNDSTTASNGLNLNGKDVRLGGNLTQATTITNNTNPLTIATGGSALNITGLPNGVSTTDSLVTVLNGQVKKLAPISTLIPNKNDSTTASNGLNLNGKDVRLGGNLTQATTIATNGNSFNITGLPNGTAATDSLVTVLNGQVKKLAPISTFIVNKNDSTTASNGLNLNGKDVRLGGTLTQATTIATNGNNFNITGLPNGTAATDSLITVLNGQVKKLAPINTLIPNKNDSTTASNGLNLNGKDVRLGGTLTQATTIATNGNNFNITGLPNGTAATDSLVTVLNGQVKKLAPINTLIPNKNDSTTASNGLNLNGKDVRLGGTLTQATTIATNGNNFNITGLPNGVSTTDSLVTVLNGQVKKLAPINTFIVNKNDSTTASNGLNLNGKDVRLGGDLTQATTITNNTNPLTIATGGSALNITGLPNGVSTTDSLVTVLNGQVKKLAPISTFIVNKNDSTTASNGLNLNGKDVRLGGTLTQATTIATNGNNFNITGLPNGVSTTDSLVTVLNGQVKKLAPISTFIVNKNDSTTASNGLNLNGKDVRLGGNLTQATTIATNGNNFNITGLPNGTAATDSLVTILNGQVKKLAPINTFIVNKNDSTTASNGLNLNGKDVRLGGNLTQATTIVTGGNALNVTGLPSGAATDSLVTINNTTGQLRKMPMADLQPRMIEIYDAAGTQTLTTTFANLVFGTTSLADNGYSVTSGAITVAAAGTYKITCRVTVRVTNNTSSGGEFRLTAGGTAIPGTLGYTYQQNANRPNGTVTIVKVVTLAANTVIAAQGRRYSNNGNLALTADGSSLLIEKVK